MTVRAPRPRAAWGFAGRLAFATSGLIVAACLVLGAILVWRDLTELARGLDERGRTIADYLARDAELSMLSGNRDELQQLATLARAQRDVLYASFIDGNGTVLASGGEVDGAPAWRFEAPIVTTDLRPQREELEFGGQPSAGHGGRQAPQKQVGTVVVGIALEPLERHRREIFLTTALFTVLVAVFAVLSAVLLAKAITRPLQALAHAADAIAQGQLHTTVDVRTGDEIGAVAGSFNAMAQSLAQSRAVLEDYSRTLEEKVRARTERLETLNRDLEEANRLKSEFLATVSHELRTPLNVIMGYTGMLAEGAGGAVSDEQSTMLVTIQRYSKLQFDLITNVLDFSRLASGQTSLHRERFALETVLHDVVALHGDGRTPTSVVLTMAVAPGLPELDTDRVKLQEVVRNLVDNAVKFTEAGTVAIEAYAGAAPGTVAIDVRDTGCGIAPDDLAHVFDEFRQVGSTRGTGGVGLGLSIAKRLVEVLGGRISVESCVGSGSTFHLEIPYQVEDLTLAKAS
jgi:two-component system sensor histidine kinase BarA